MSDNPISFMLDALRIVWNLQRPSLGQVLTNLVKISIVISISSVLFSVIDSIVAPVAKFLLKG